MLRRDAIIFLLVIAWATINFLFLPTIDAKILIPTFGWGMIGLLIALVLLMVLSSLIPKFGKWGDKKMF